MIPLSKCLKPKYLTSKRGVLGWEIPLLHYRMAYDGMTGLSHFSTHEHEFCLHLDNTERKLHHRYQPIGTPQDSQNSSFGNLGGQHCSVLALRLMEISVFILCWRPSPCSAEPSWLNMLILDWALNEISSLAKSVTDVKCLSL